MFIRLAELGLLLFMLWILANVIKACLYKSSLGGGFWGLSNWMTNEDRQREQEKVIEAEVQRRLALRVAMEAEKTEKERGE